MVASPAVAALIAYARAEATALLSSNIEIVHALVEALIEHGTLSGAEIDTIIAHQVALQSIEVEHKRRDDWRRRTLNAARFLEKIEP